MSNLDALRGQLRSLEERTDPLQPRRLGMIAFAIVLLIAGVVGAADMHLLPTYSADDAGSILFGAG